MIITQYNIVLVDLSPTKGSEINKTRPCVVVSPDEINKNLRTVIICPLTSTIKDYPTRINILHKGKIGAIAIDQIRTIDKNRVVKTIGKISISEIEQIKEKMKEMLVY